MAVLIHPSHAQVRAQGTPVAPPSITCTDTLLAHKETGSSCGSLTEAELIAYVRKHIHGAAEEAGQGGREEEWVVV